MLETVSEKQVPIGAVGLEKRFWRKKLEKLVLEKWGTSQRIHVAWHQSNLEIANGCT